MADFMSYDPWKSQTTRNGLQGDEVISGLQKSIRRGNEETAVEMAYEMYITSEQFEDKLWRRLSAIAVEDVGFGEPMAPVVVDALDRMRQKFPYNDGDRPIFFMHAIRYLCACQKERSTDCLKNIVMKKFARGFKPTIPDYAFDVHTDKGRAMGRDVMHFLEEASRVEPQMEGYDDTYRQKLMAMIREEESGEELPKADNPFEYAAWQY